MMKKLVSVVIPVYNVEKYLQECLDSVISQTYTKLEIILVDDGSTDSSADICNEYAKNDSRVHVIHKTNGGASSARNVGLQIANGEYVYFLDSDDFINQTAIEKLVDMAERNDADLVFMDGLVFDDGVNSGKQEDCYKHTVYYETSFGRNIIRKQFTNDDFFVLVQMILFKRELLLNNQLSFYEGIVCEDELFVFYAFYYARIVAHLPEQLLHRRMRADSVMTSMNNEKRFLSILTVFDDMMSHFETKNDDVLTMRFRMLANGVYNLYYSLDEDLKKTHYRKYQDFICRLYKHHGFGDLKLLEKCSSGWRRKYYHLKRKASQKKHENYCFCN